MAHGKRGRGMATAGVAALAALAAAAVLAAASTAQASEEDYAVINAVKFTCRPMKPFADTTVEAVADGDGAARRLTLLRVTSKDFDIRIPKEALDDLRVPMLDTLRLSTEAGYDKTPWMYVTFQLGNPQPGRMWDYPRAYVKIKDGKVVGRALRRRLNNQVTFEDLPMPAAATSPATPATRPAASAAEINELIAQLGHDDYKTREAASKRLIAMGKPVRAALEAKQKEKGLDPEVASRLEAILERLLGDAEVTDAATGITVRIVHGGEAIEGSKDGKTLWQTGVPAGGRDLQIEKGNVKVLPIHWTLDVRTGKVVNIGRQEGRIIHMERAGADVQAERLAKEAAKAAALDAADRLKAEDAAAAAKQAQEEAKRKAQAEEAARRAAQDRN